MGSLRALGGRFCLVFWVVTLGFGSAGRAQDWVVPNVTGLTKDAAGLEITGHGLTPQFIGAADAAEIEWQYPSPYTELSQDAPVWFAEQIDVTVPDLVNDATLADTRQQFIELGLVVVAYSAGDVCEPVEQWTVEELVANGPDTGHAVPIGSVVGVIVRPVVSITELIAWAVAAGLGLASILLWRALFRARRQLRDRSA